MENQNEEIEILTLEEALEHAKIRARGGYMTKSADFRKIEDWVREAEEDYLSVLAERVRKMEDSETRQADIADFIENLTESATSVDKLIEATKSEHQSLEEILNVVGAATNNAEKIENFNARENKRNHIKIAKTQASQQENIRDKENVEKGLQQTTARKESYDKKVEVVRAYLNYAKYNIYSAEINGEDAVNKIEAEKYAKLLEKDPENEDFKSDLALCQAREKAYAEKLVEVGDELTKCDVMIAKEESAKYRMETKPKQEDLIPADELDDAQTRIAKNTKKLEKQNKRQVVKEPGNQVSQQTSDNNNGAGVGNGKSETQKSKLKIGKVLKPALAVVGSLGLLLGVATTVDAGRAYWGGSSDAESLYTQTLGENSEAKVNANDADGKVVDGIVYDVVKTTKDEDVSYSLSLGDASIRSLFSAASEKEFHGYFDGVYADSMVKKLGTLLGEAAAKDVVAAVEAGFDVDDAIFTITQNSNGSVTYSLSEAPLADNLKSLMLKNGLTEGQAEKCVKNFKVAYGANTDLERWTAAKENDANIGDEQDNTSGGGSGQGSSEVVVKADNITALAGSNEVAAALNAILEVANKEVGTIIIDETTGTVNVVTEDGSRLYTISVGTEELSDILASETNAAAVEALTTVIEEATEKYEQGDTSAVRTSYNVKKYYQDSAGNTTDIYFEEDVDAYKSNEDDEVFASCVESSDGKQMVVTLTTVAADETVTSDETTCGRTIKAGDADEVKMMIDAALRDSSNAYATIISTTKGVVSYEFVDTDGNTILSNVSNLDKNNDHSL